MDFNFPHFQQIFGYFPFSQKLNIFGKLSTLVWGGEFISTSLEHPGFLDGVSVRKNQLWKCLPPLLGFVGRLTAIELSFCQTIIMHFLAAPITIYNIRIRHRKEWKRIHLAIAIARVSYLFLDDECHPNFFHSYLREIFFSSFMQIKVEFIYSWKLGFHGICGKLKWFVHLKILSMRRKCLEF